MTKSKFHKTDNYRGPASAEDEPMNDTLVKLILRSAGFSSPEEVRKVAKREQDKALNKSTIDFDTPDWVKRVEPAEKKLPC